MERSAQNFSTCRGCGRQILWTRMASGKRMPCDPDLVTYWQRPGGSKKIVTPNGEVISAELSGDLDKATGVGYVSHFATCPEGDRFRKGAQK